MVRKIVYVVLGIFFGPVIGSVPLMMLNLRGDQVGVSFMIGSAFIGAVLGYWIADKLNKPGKEKNIFDSTVDDCVVSDKNRGSKIYNEDEAVCYIYKYLGGKDVTKDEINHVVQLENKYRDSNPPVGSGNDPVPAYIYQNQTMKLTQEKIDRIYDAESYYLKFIGVK